MKTLNPPRALLLAWLATAASAYALSVGTNGTGVVTFDSAPALGDWATLSVGANDAAGITDTAGLDAGVQALSAAEVITAIGSSSTLPPSGNGIARRNTSLNVLQTRTSGNTFLVFMATLTNNTGAAASVVTVSYDFASLTNDIVESVPGWRAYYSLTGAAGSWQLIPELTTGTSGFLSVNLKLNWAPGAVLYLLWADDNGDGSTSASSGLEGMYTMDNFQVVALAGGTPVFKSFRYSPVELVAEIEDGNPPGAVDVNGITAALNGAPITTQAAKTAGITTVSYKPSTPFPAGSTNTVEYTFYDNQSRTQTVSRTFVVSAWKGIPASYAVTGVDTSKPGFKVRVHQIPVARGPGNENSTENAEKQLAGQMIDPATGSPYPNEADLSLADPATGLFSIPDGSHTGVINWNALAPTQAGNFTDTSTPPMQDEMVPGIPGVNVSYLHFAAEIVTMLQLKAGLYTMGVNSDDGFKVTVGPNPRDVFALNLGEYGDGRSAADTLFDFIVEADGIYPFRLAYWQGTGDGSVEWFTVDAAGKKVLINDQSQPTAVKAYMNQPAAPIFAKWISPAPDAKNVAANSTVTVVLSDGATQVQQSSVKMFVNDTAVNPVVTKAAGDTTITYDPAADFKPEQVVNVRVVFSDNATPVKETTLQYSFQIKPIVLIAVDDATKWRYENSGQDLGTAWREKNFNDSSWPQGAAAFSAGESAANTQETLRTGNLSRTSADGSTQITTDYFRTHFTFAGNPGAVRLYIRHLVDDGVVFYLNGTEVHRFGISASTTIINTTTASDHENAWEGPFAISTAALVQGDNVLAAEVHQTSSTSSDMVFAAELLASTQDLPSSVLQSFSPAVNAVEVLTNAPLQFVITDGTEQVVPSSIKLTVSGREVTPTISKPAGDFVTTVTYVPAGGWSVGATVPVQFSYADTGNPSTAMTNLQYSFAVRPDFKVILGINDTQMWRYENTGQTNLGTAWYGKTFDDSAWPEGPALLAYETGSTAEPVRTTLSRTATDGSNIISDYFRTHFTFNGDLSKTRLRIRHVVDDGFVLYLNGVEVYRYLLAEGTSITATNLTTTDHENRWEGPFDLPALAMSALVAGDNVLAAEVHQSAADSSDVVFGIELHAVDVPTVVELPTFTKVSKAGDTMVIEWTGTGTLQSSDVLTGGWADVPNAQSPYPVPTTGAAKFFRFKP